ncbi:MAG: cell division protein FtsX [Pseudomonadota bacterium]
MRKRAADRIVPRHGIAPRLTVATTAAMTFLATLCLAAALAALDMSGRWTHALDDVATVEIADGDSAATARALDLLRATPGILSVEELSPDRQAALLSPWLGDGFPVDALSLPRLIAVEEGAALDRAALRTTLTTTVPGARYITPDGWRRDLAQRVALLGWAALGLVALMLAVTACVIVLAVSTAVTAEAATVATLRLIGAFDGFIRGIFVRRFTRRAIAGALLGWALALGLQAVAARETLLPLALGLSLLPPALAVASAYVAAQATALWLLRRDRFGDL